MRRVTQYDLYMLGTVRSLLHIKAGDKIASHREAVVLSYIALNGFSEDLENVSLSEKIRRDGENAPYPDC